MRSKRGGLFLMVAVLFALASCANAGASQDMAAGPAMSYAVDDDGDYAGGTEWEGAPGNGTVTDTSVDFPRLIIRDANLSIVVPDTAEALEDIEALVGSLEGYVVESTVSQYQEGQQATMRLRVPAEQLDQALERIRGMASEVRSESITGQDVTEEYVDLSSRLRYLEATEERLLEFLDEAEDTEAALAVYQQLQTIQADIEYVTGRMQYLEQSAAMATITLTITPDALAQPIQVGGWNLQGAWRDAVEDLVDFVQFMVEDVAIRLVVVVLPALLFIFGPFVALFFIVRALVRRRRARKEGKGQE